MATPKQIESTFVVSDPDLAVQTIDVTESGSFVIVPKRVWHTANPHRPTRMPFVTPGEGTENREQPVRESK